MNDFNQGIIQEFRENGGAVGRGFGTDLVLVHSRGAKSGEARISPVLALRDADGWLIAASKGGSPTHPDWYHNLVAHPETAIEVPAGDGVETVPVRADVVPEEGYGEAWARFTAHSPAFEQYAGRTGGRRIPVVRLAPR